MLYRHPATISRRMTSAAPDMDLLNDNECITRLKTCNTRRVKRNMDHTHLFLRDGSTTSKYRKLLSDVGWVEQDIMLFDRNCLGQ